ncbi:TonB-dependent receptor, partial [candidate division KSB1 bacterium]|nr:TonB-dependent receptor [candidate division KSB1 bacterium]
GSALYGGGAVAGVVNVITRTPMLNQVRIKYQNNSTGGVLDQHVGAVAETVYRKGTSGAYVFGSFRRRDPYDHNGDGFSELGELRNESMGFKWYYQPFENSQIMASFHQIHEERRGGNKFELPPHEADLAEWIEHWRSGGTVRFSYRPGPLVDFRLFYSFSIENRKSYYGGRRGDTPQDQLDALAFYGKTDNPLHMAGVQTNYRTNNHLLTAGVHYTHDRLEDKTSAETVYYLDELFRNIGVFIQDDLHLGDNQEVEVVAGLRMDNHSELENWIASPRINVKVDVGKGAALRGAYTTGFKPPQIYDEDLHLCGIEGDQRIVRNSKELKEERSHSFSGGLEYLGSFGRIPTMLSVTVFYVRLIDSFAERFVFKQGVIERWERINSDGAEVRGVEWDFGVRPLSRLEMRGGLTWKKSRYDSPLADFDTRNFLRTSDWNGNLRFSLAATRHLDLYLHGSYIGKADVPHELASEGEDVPVLLLVRSDDFIQLDCGMTFKLPLNNGLGAKFNIGVKNLLNAYQRDLDRGVTRDPAYVYGPARPRTFFFGVETAF